MSIDLGMWPSKDALESAAKTLDWLFEFAKKTDKFNHRIHHNLEQAKFHCENKIKKLYAESAK